MIIILCSSNFIAYYDEIHETMMIMTCGILTLGIKLDIPVFLSISGLFPVIN